MAMAAMANKLKNTNDAFKIRDEIGYVCVATAITSGRQRRESCLRHNHGPFCPPLSRLYGSGLDNTIQG